MAAGRLRRGVLSFLAGPGGVRGVPEDKGEELQLKNAKEQVTHFLIFNDCSTLLRGTVPGSRFDSSAVPHSTRKFRVTGSLWAAPEQVPSHLILPGLRDGLAGPISNHKP
jgi:hypothetical protein